MSIYFLIQDMSPIILKSASEGIKISHVTLIWLILNLISASFTLLYTDEAYYKLFSQQLSLGYFDHPPMIALFIRVGSHIFNNETGVRLLSVISVTAALFLTYRVSCVQKPVLFMFLTILDSSYTYYIC